MAKKVNVFLPITPYTLSIAENLVGNLLLDSVNILINPHGLSYNQEIWDQVYQGNCSRIVKENRVLRYFNFLNQVIVFSILRFKIRKLLSLKFNFYYVDLAHVLSNAIFFGSENIQDRLIIEDGLLNYYRLPLTGKMLDKPSANMFLRIFGLRTKRFSGDITGLEMEIVNGQYVFFPKIAFMPNKSRQIPFQKIDYPSDGDRILILGQEPMVSLIPGEEYCNLLKILAQTIQDETSFKSRWYYKPHHHGDKEVSKGFLKELLGNNLIFVNDNRPIHELVSEIKPSIVTSFGSTASMNLKLFLPDHVESRVFIVDNHNVPRNRKLESIFEKMDISVSIIKVNE